MELLTLLSFGILTIVYIGASIVLLRSISGFRSRLRIAYAIIVTGIIIQTLNHASEVLATYMQWWDEGWFQAAQVSGYTLAPLALYFGARGFGRLLQIKSITTSFIFALVTGIPLAMAGGYLAGKEGRMNSEIVFPIFIIWLLIMATAILVQAARQASQIYRSSIFWLAWPVGMLTAGAALYTFSVVVPLPGGVVTIPYVIGGLLLCKAAYEFYKIRNRQLGELNKIEKMGSSVDIVIYAASLASNPRAVEPLMDELRVITASKGQSLTAADQEKLRSLYLRLEEYVADKDPVRTYAPEVIRDLITQKLRQNKAMEQTFWPAV